MSERAGRAQPRENNLRIMAFIDDSSVSRWSLVRAMEETLQRQEVIDWLKSGRCPECHYTFKVCTCGATVKELLYLAAESPEVTMKKVKNETRESAAPPKPDRIFELTRALRLAKTRLGICLGRFAGCEDGAYSKTTITYGDKVEKRHEVSLAEIPAWIEEMQEVLERGDN